MKMKIDISNKVLPDTAKPFLGIILLDVFIALWNYLTRKLDE